MVTTLSGKFWRRRGLPLRLRRGHRGICLRWLKRQSLPGSAVNAGCGLYLKRGFAMDAGSGPPGLRSRGASYEKRKMPEMRGGHAAWDLSRTTDEGGLCPCDVRPLWDGCDAEGWVMGKRLVNIHVEDEFER